MIMLCVLPDVRDKQLCSSLLLCAYFAILRKQQTLLIALFEECYMCCSAVQSSEIFQELVVSAMWGSVIKLSSSLLAVSTLTH